MITNKDVQKLLTAFKTVFATREELDEKFGKLNNKFNDLQSAVDGYAKKADAYFQEMVMLSHRVNKLEKWVQQIAEKAGVKLED
jgi:uncharacterized coiled-coil DUF342 family protein